MGRVNVEIEKKYVIIKPDISVLREQESFSESEILQIYLPSEPGRTRRVRRRAYADRTVYIETQKIRIDKMSSTEIEREVSADEFEKMAANIADGTRPLNKTRYTFVYRGQLFEVDVYPEWEHTCIMETELPTRETAVDFPDFIRIVRDVTGVKEYSNAAMSRSFPKEDDLNENNG